MFSQLQASYSNEFETAGLLLIGRNAKGSGCDSF
jgi:hypothetical protein